MACFHPLTAYRMPKGYAQKFGEREISFDVRYADMPGVSELKLPCGQCIGCRLAKSRDWALRAMHEASLYEHNCFITLTYDDAHYPENGSLNIEDYQLFMKRLRKKFGSGIRFLHCGEYGTLLDRPHHHACLFNFDFPDKKLWSMSGGNPIYLSESLADLWTYGFHTIGDFSYDTAAYVARYVTKKITGDLADEHYQGRKPEYITMSRRPGIGHDWYEQFKKDCYPKDFVTSKDGIKLKPAKYYDRLFDREYPDAMNLIKEKRLNDLEKRVADFTPERLKAKEELLKLTFKEKMQRKYEMGLVDQNRGDSR